MMLKRCLILLLGILSLITTANGQDIVLPRDIAEKVYIDIKENERQKIVINLQDSTIRVYEKVVEGYERQVAALKLSNTAYEQAIKGLEAMDKVRQKQLDDKDKKHKRQVRKHILIIALEAILIVLLAL